MDDRVFDPGKILLLLGVVLLSVTVANAAYECNYLESIPERLGWFSIEKMECQFGCCGDLWDQKCCSEPEIDNKHWIITVSVIGGLLGLAVVTIIVLCVLKAKNLERAKIYTNDPPARTRNTTSYCDLAENDEPPPYSPRTYAIFTTDTSARAKTGQTGSNQAGPSGEHGQAIVHSRPPVTGRTNMEGRLNMEGLPSAPSRLPPLRSAPPAYNFIDARTTEST